MSKEFTCVGLMSGTSADGVDASVINSDGNDKYNVIKNKFFKYPFEIYNLIHNLKTFNYLFLNIFINYNYYDYIQLELRRKSAYI